MARRTLIQIEVPVVVQVDPLECPFREFRDNELAVDAWGMGTAAYRAWLNAANIKALPKSADSTQRPGTTSQSPKGGGAQVKGGGDKSKTATTISPLWVDDQTQPLPRSVRQYLHGWIRAEDLAMDRWGAEVTIFDENDVLSKMAIADVQLCHAQVLFRSSFCRKVLSACFALERMEHLNVEHQWESFNCALGPEGWRAKCHIYSPGLKPGGGVQHKPTLSKNGCYLVRLFYLGAWRCIWVNDQIPVDTSGAPLLPFSPLLTHPPAKPGSTRIPPAVTASEIYLWPLLLTKALLKLAAPDMNSDEDAEDVEDEVMLEFDILHALIGSVNVRHYSPETLDELWTIMTAEVPLFCWDIEEDASTVKSRSTKKPTAKELASVVKRTTMTYAVIKDSKELQPYILPGITPGHEMCLYVMMARDVPIKKPLPEPEVALWKYYRWVDWAKRHGLYAAYDCPRTKFIKVNGLLKSSYAPHLLDVQSTESITKGFLEEHGLSNATQKGDDDAPKKKKVPKSQAPQSAALSQQARAELREWIQLDAFHSLLKYFQVVFYPSLYSFTSAGSNPPVRINLKASSVMRMTDIAAPKNSPLYLQLDGPEVNKLRVCLAALHPRILSNSGFPVDEYIDPAHLVIEKFEWFKDTTMPNQRAYMAARRYESLEITLDPGRHFFRIWTYYRINWHMMMISESSLLLSTRDVVLGAAVHECPWASKFLLNLGSSFSNWIKISRTNQTIIFADREFFSSYLPDLTWDKDVVGYDNHLLHWMFRQALQSHLSKVMNQTEWKAVTHVLRKYFCDPDFGFPVKPPPPKSLRELTNAEICDCLMPEVEEVEGAEEQEPREVTFVGEPEQVNEEEIPLVAPEIMDKLLVAPEPPITSQICEMATDALPCAVLKEERDKTVKKHEAASVIQAYWRGTWARKVLAANITFTPETTKLINERAFGTLEGLSRLMNEFFFMWPGAKYAYSVASALSGDCGLQQHTGMTPVTAKCKWIPHFQGVFFCHAPVKVHFDVQSSVAHSTVEVYNNDSGEHLPQVYNSHITFDFAPNILGYTVIGHGTLAEVSGVNYEANWQLTIMSCLSDAFHICDNDEFCKELPLPQASKLHVDEIFVPNRRNILGGIKISVPMHEAVSFRAAASSSDLEMVATLRLLLPDGGTEEISTCSGKGEIYWPYIRLDATPVTKNKQPSAALVGNRSVTKTPKSPKGLLHSKNRSTSKIRLNVHEPNLYSIEVTCPAGWPLTLDQWKRVNEVRNTHDSLEMHVQKKATATVKEKEKGKTSTVKEKPEKATQVVRAAQQPQPGDAFVELECALAIGSGAVASRDDERDLAYLMARRSWAALDSGRNQAGVHIRKEFRAEFLVAPPLPTGLQSSSFASQSGSSPHLNEGTVFENEAEETKDGDFPRPTPVSETDVFEMTVETEEEALYLLMPDLLRDKFIPLDFLPFCTKEKNEEKCILITPDMAEAAKNDRHARLEAALERMRELQIFNEEHVLGRQKTRCKLLENLFVDATFTPDLVEMMIQKEEAVAQEVNLRTLSATKKKTESKKK